MRSTDPRRSARLAGLRYIHPAVLEGYIAGDLALPLHIDTEGSCQEGFG